MARGSQLNVRLSEAEARDVQEAAAECELSPSEWARLVLTHAAGRHSLSEQLERASDVGAKAFWAAVGEAGGKRPRKNAKKPATP